MAFAAPNLAPLTFTSSGKGKPFPQEHFHKALRYNPVGLAWTAPTPEETNHYGHGNATCWKPRKARGKQWMQCSCSWNTIEELSKGEKGENKKVHQADLQGMLGKKKGPPPCRFWFTADHHTTSIASFIFKCCLSCFLLRAYMYS